MGYKQLENVVHKSIERQLFDEPITFQYTFMGKYQSVK